MKEYAAELTKQDLINWNITNCTEDGRVFGLDGQELEQKLKRNNKKERDTNNEYYYVYTGVKQIDVHRAIYIWFHGIQHAGMVIDHLNNIKKDNRLENLQEITPGQNLAKDRKYNRILKPKRDTKESLRKKLKEATELYEEAKKRHDAKAAHKYRTNKSIFEAKLRWLEQENGIKTE